MAELTPSERLQPSLLDRLTDEEPAQSQEARNRRVLSIQRLRECVLRDVAWLLNTTNLAQKDLAETHPLVAQSVVETRRAASDSTERPARAAGANVRDGGSLGRSPMRGA